MREAIDGIIFRDMLINAAIHLEAQKQVINDLNVFPVPDGDTGTNMSLTMNAAMTELNAHPHDDIGAAAETAAAALLRGARGNSGVILSLLFRGFARSLKNKTSASSADIALAMSEGVTAAYKAVMKPSEGTILTVSRLAAAAACESAENQDVETVYEAAVIAARTALADTINQNPILKKAGVIDAGGKGYLIILEAMLAALRGETPVVTELPSEQPVESAVFSGLEDFDITMPYCTEFIVSRDNDRNPQWLSQFLENIGNSLVLVDDDEIIKVHVHTNRPGDVLTAALNYGSLLTVKIENMREQHTAAIVREQKPRIAEALKELAVVAVCAGAGIQALYKDLGADRLVHGGQTMNPSTEDLLSAINNAPAETVFVLPNNRNIHMAAQQCSAMTDKSVIVIPTTSIAQGITALLAFDPKAAPETNEENMTEAIKAVHTITITHAARDTVFDGLAICQGDYLALLEGKLLCTASDTDGLLELITKTVSDFTPDYITVFYGEGVPVEIASVFSQTLAEAVPDAEIATVDGGQPVYYMIISAE